MKKADVIFSIVLLCVIVWSVWEASHWSNRARLFPIAIGIPATVLGAIQVAFAVRSARRLTETLQADVPPATSAGIGGESEGALGLAEERAFGPDSTAEGDIPDEIVRDRTIQIVGWILAITAGIVLLGFELGSAVLTFIFLHYGAGEKARTSAIIAVATYLFFYVIFDRALSIPFPPGTIADAFGLDALDHYLMDPIAGLIRPR